uniref:Ion_trans_2 domain-containing protein n=1 Tax=Strongyloides papillosus TaxID=174720 RepID=A0A0N5CCX4_STREA
MLGARGVSLGLGKINLSDLNKIPAMDRGQIPRIKKKPKVKPRVRVKKYVDKKTLWTACRTVIFGVIIISLGMIMTGLGYFDKELAKVTVYNETITSNITYIDNFRRIQFKSMQYIGPVLMGIGSFMLIIACVITLESRDKHTLIIQNEADKQRKIIKDDNEKENFIEIKETIFLNTKKYKKDGEIVSEDNNNTSENAEDDNSSHIECGKELSIDVEDLENECFRTPEKERDSKYSKRRATISHQYSKSMVDKNRVRELKTDHLSRRGTVSPSTSFRRPSNTRRRSMFSLQGDDHSVSTDNLAKQHLYENRDLYAELLEDFYNKYGGKSIKDITENNLLPSTNLDNILIHNITNQKIQEEDTENN